MATNASNITHNKANGEDWMHLPASHCIPWLVVFSIESLAIVILNAIIIVVFVKQRQLQKKSTYLLIHLAIVDFFVGVVSGPLEIEDVGSMYCDLWKYVDLDFWLAMSKHGIGKNFPQISLFNLAFISLERAHATFRPFKHRFVKKWVYGVMITVVCNSVLHVTQGAVGYGLRDCSFVNILPRGSDNLEIIDLEQEKPGAELGPLRNSGGDWASPREAVGGQLDALVSIREKVSHPDFDAVRHVGADDHSDKYLMFDKIKGLAIVK
ncbi:Histamine H4 receptor [Stylophora pistillata]|uniref:Histamine H4 receptor n=1 Tax=Stylophora pistillata TaxID=50429 RepID=A0A2B4RTL0_STYPI|nr:Histamine H4 receptor [Stylophora pistillata]